MMRLPIAKRFFCLALGMFAAGRPATAQGGVPPVGTQAPGYYRMMLGEFEITALNDGVVAYPVTTLTGATPEQIRSGLAESRLTDPVDMSYNAFLVNTGSHLVLIDVGTGGKMAESPWFRGAGRLLANLRAAGYQPEQVDVVLITHRGPDHVGALTQGASRTFPNATVRAARREVSAFLDSATVAAAVSKSRNPEGTRTLLRFLAGLFEPYIAAGRFEPFDADIAIVPGIRSLATPGHTAGHTSYVVESAGQRLIVMGDLVHWPAVQFPYPSVTTAFDEQAVRGTESRRRIFAEAAESDAWVAGAHMPFPGLGRIRAGEGRYYWVPPPYSIPR